MKRLDIEYRAHLEKTLKDIWGKVNKAREGNIKTRIRAVISQIEKLEEKIRKMAEIANREIAEKLTDLLARLLAPESSEEAKEAVEDLEEMIWGDRKEEKTGRINTVLPLALALMITGNYGNILRITAEASGQLKTGFITGLMTMIGAVAGSTAMLQALNSGWSGILDFLNYKMPTIAWVIIQIVILLIMLAFVKKKIVGNGKLIATGIAGAVGILAYANENKAGLLGNVPCHVTLSAILWVWDEFDDFQDAKERIDNISKPPELSGSDRRERIMDALELYLLPFILGLFSSWMGIDQMVVLERIPGRWGFVKYVSYATLPEPWNTVVNAVYEILAFVLANVIASGAAGIGWILYTIGSVLASYTFNNALSILFS